MEMNSTLENDSAVFSTTVGVSSEAGSNTIYSVSASDNSITINTSKFPLMQDTTSGITKTTDKFFPYYGVSSLTGGVVYFMCQATGYKLKSNKELPSPSQKFSYVIPKTNVTNSGDKPNANQQRPMFAEIKLDNNQYTIYLYRIEDIMVGTNLFSQLSYSTAQASYKYLKGNDCDIPDPLPEGETEESYREKNKIYGKWGTNKIELKVV